MRVNNVHKNYKFVPPDGGWGYVICVAITMNLIVLNGFTSCSRIVLKETFLELKMDATGIAVLNAVGVLCVAIAGFSTGILLNYITLRKLGFIAASLYTAGSLGTALSTSIATIVIFQGILQNLGHGLMFNISYTIFNQYFVHNRLFAMSISQAVIALATFFTPTVVKWILDRYGSLWTLLLLSAISLHNLLAVALMRPASWYMKRLEIPETKDRELKTSLKEDKNVGSKQVGVASVDSNRLIAEGKNVRNTDVETRRDIIAMFKDKELYQNFILSNACLGLSLVMFCDVFYMSMVPQALYYMGWSENLVAWATRLFAMGNIITRVLFALCSKWLCKMETREIYIIGILFACLSRLGMLWSDNRPAMLTCVSLVGVARCAVEVLHPLVLGDAVPPQQFTNAMGISMLSYGVISVLLRPTICAIRELTDSYATVFYILTSCFAIVVIFWTIELVYKKNAHKRKPRRSFSEKLLHASL